jgi:hypothetical protein
MKKKTQKHKKKELSTSKSKKKSLLNIFLNKNSKKIYSLFNNKDIIEMINYYQEDDNTFTKESDRCMCIDYEVMGNDYNMENNQDYRRCKHKTHNNTDFCKIHQKCNSFLSQSLNGHEIDYRPGEWSHPYIEGTHNCYSYFLNDRQMSIKKKCEKICKKKHGTDCPKKMSDCGDLKPQPGDYSLLMTEGNLKSKKRNYKCIEMEKKIKQDNPSIKNTTLLSKCPNRHYKGAMVVDDDHTFHFYRQNSDATWSHKPGTQKVVNIDASNRKIHIPHFSNRDYSNKPNKIKYNSFCNYYCIPNNSHIKTNSI